MSIEGLPPSTLLVWVCKQCVAYDISPDYLAHMDGAHRESVEAVPYVKSRFYTPIEEKE